MVTNGASSSRWLSIEEGDNYVDVEEKQLPYTQRRILGSGGCSVVDEVEDRTTGRVFARKVFIPKTRNRRRMKELFDNELKVVQSLKHHHHIIRIFATYTVKETGVLALLLTPVADGGDLDNYLDKFSTYLLSDRLKNSAQILTMGYTLYNAFGCLAAGLAFMHKNKIRHKDIKAQNILIHQGRVLYTDFGLSFDSNMCENSTTEGPTDMTRKYAAPEVLAGEPRNSSSDVYSLGCVFIEISAALHKPLHHDDIHRFSASMDAIHEKLSTRNDCPSEMSFIPRVILEMTSRHPPSRWTADHVWKTCAKYLLFVCDDCQYVSSDADMKDMKDMDQIPASRNSYYTPWTWSDTHNRHYSYFMSPDGRRLDTIWSGPPTGNPVTPT